MEEKLHIAARCGGEEEARTILREHPEVDVNWKNEELANKTALHRACARGHPNIVTLLLSHPDIDANPQSETGITPFFEVCYKGTTSCARLLLKDPRVVLDCPDIFGKTALWNAVRRGHIEVIKWWLASGRELDLGRSRNWRTDPIAMGQKTGQVDAVDLLKRFKEDAKKTRHEMRVEVGWYAETAAEVFALVIFLCDGLLKIRAEGQSNAARFMRIMCELPMELQMMLCRRAAGSAAENIPGEYRELAFRDLARKLVA